MSNEEKNGNALPDEVLDLVTGGRDLYQSEDEFFNYTYNSLIGLGLMTEDEIDNMMAYLLCVDNLVDGSPEFFYNMKADYRKVWEKQTGQKWQKWTPKQ